MASSEAATSAARLDEYRRAVQTFKPKDAENLLPEIPGLARAEEQFAKWRSGAHDNSIALVGTPGTGACITLAALQRKFSRNVPCTTISLDRYSIAKDGLAGALGSELGCGRSAGMDELLKALGEAEMQVIFLHGCHNLFVRRVGGFETLYDLHHLLSFTRGKVLWVTQWSPYTWYYLQRTIGFASYFDIVVQFNRLPVDVLVQWLRLKHDATGETVEFYRETEQCVAEEGCWLPEVHRQRLEAVAHGNLEEATAAWVQATTLGADGTVRVGLFPRFDAAPFEQLTEEDYYILCSLLFHSELSLDYLAEDMNLAELDTRMRIDHLANRGVVTFERQSATCAIRAAALPDVVAALRTRNLIDAKESNGS